MPLFEFVFDKISKSKFAFDQLVTSLIYPQNRDFDVGIKSQLTAHIITTGCITVHVWSYLYLVVVLLLNVFCCIDWHTCPHRCTWHQGLMLALTNVQVVPFVIELLWPKLTLVSQSVSVDQLTNLSEHAWMASSGTTTELHILYDI